MLKNKHGEFWLEVKNAALFNVVQYEGHKDQHYICFHTSSICMYHQGENDCDCSHVIRVGLQLFVGAIDEVKCFLVASLITRLFVN